MSEDTLFGFSAGSRGGAGLGGDVELQVWFRCGAPLRNPFKAANSMMGNRGVN